MAECTLREYVHKVIELGMYFLIIVTPARNETGAPDRMFRVQQYP